MGTETLRDVHQPCSKASEHASHPPVQGGFSASYTGVVTPAASQPDVPQQFQKEITIHVIKGDDHELVSLFFFYLTQ